MRISSALFLLSITARAYDVKNYLHATPDDLHVILNMAKRGLISHIPESFSLKDSTGKSHDEMLLSIANFSHECCKLWQEL